MNRPRLTVFLMIENGYVRKSVQFKSSVYIGDPLNTVKIFSDFEVDELIFVDISATKENRNPDYGLIKNIASVSRMPLCYGGGINNLDQIEKIINLGVEKISICSAAILNKSLVKEAAATFGKQSIVGCLDIKYSKELKKYQVYTHNGNKNLNLGLESCIEFLVTNGVGEILINNIDLDGTYGGFNLDLISKITELTPVPVSICGGASSYLDIKNLWKNTNISGIVSGSLWSFYENNNTVLLNYPNKKDKLNLFASKKT
jgi:cyclase|tara:strand:- start:387 stop:1163 length:777 start_codon:yes stop_codon:yes gene_type:complete